MDHLTQFTSRPVTALPAVASKGWHLKRYAILAPERTFENDVADAACRASLRRLPAPGAMEDGSANQGVAFQIVHFAQVAVVVPTFYWQWGSVLANMQQMRAPWNNPTEFEDGVENVVGCIWEMDIVAHEVNAWRQMVLNGKGSPDRRIADYMQHSYAA